MLSYCDTRSHKGTIYRAAGFALSRTNERGIETYHSTAVAPLTSYQRDGSGRISNGASDTQAYVL